MQLRAVLLLNALSCLFFGGLFAVSSYPVSTYLSGANDSEGVIFFAGLILLFNAGHLIKAALLGPRPWEVSYFVAGDLGWVLGTLILVVSGLLITTKAGIIASLAVAALVGAFGVLQWCYRSQVSTKAS